MSGRRLLLLLLLLGVIGIPAGALTAVCAGASCDDGDRGTSRVPFCPLPDALKGSIANGFREGRSPDVLGVTRDVPVFTALGGTGARSPWPALDPATDMRVPIVFAGTGASPGATLPAGVTLDRIAPTVGEIVGLSRPFPEVRSGVAVEGVADGGRPDLVLLVVWKFTGSSSLEHRPQDWPFLASLLRDGAGTLEGTTGSLPLDPSATITTIGTGGLPFQHGITGSFVRNDDGEVVAAFAPGAPVPVIATLAEDLDEANGQRPEVALVASDGRDRGLTGGAWYPDHDADTVVVARAEDAVTAVRSVLAEDVPDLLGVVLDGNLRRLDARTEMIVRAARSAAGGSVLVVVAGAGGSEGSRLARPDADLVDAVEQAVPGGASAVAAVVPGGIYLDQNVLADAEVTGQVAVDALLRVSAPGGDGPVMTDAFQGFAVSFARYCPGEA